MSTLSHVTHSQHERTVDIIRNRALGLFTGQKKNNISAPSQTVATALIAPKVCQGQPPTFRSQHSNFHPNRFTFGAVIAERVNAVLGPIE